MDKIAAEWFSDSSSSFELPEALMEKTTKLTQNFIKRLEADADLPEANSLKKSYSANLLLLGELYKVVQNWRAICSQGREYQEKLTEEQRVLARHNARHSREQSMKDEITHLKSDSVKNDLDSTKTMLQNERALLSKEHDLLENERAKSSAAENGASKLEKLLSSEKETSARMEKEVFRLEGLLEVEKTRNVHAQEIENLTCIQQTTPANASKEINRLTDSLEFEKSKSTNANEEVLGLQNLLTEERVILANVKEEMSDIQDKLLLMTKQLEAKTAALTVSHGQISKLESEILTKIEKCKRLAQEMQDVESEPAVH